MKLSDAIRIQGAEVIALVGAGGKTTALFQLAHQSGGAVFVTTTTHLHRDQLVFADRHFEIQPDGILPDFWEQIPDGVSLFTGEHLEDQRVSGLSALQLDGLYQAAQAHKIPLLIEADGSRRKPLKAPADHEPAIPDFVDRVIVVAGLSAVGQPLDSKHVHRPEIFATLSGLQPGDRISPESLAAVLSHAMGGLKGIPARAEKVLLLNQADDMASQALASSVALKLQQSFDKVLIAALQEQSVFSVYQPVAGVVLAAGAATRMGQAKQLLDWHGQPLVRHVAQTALDAGLWPIVIVVGAQQSEIAQAVAGLAVELVSNADWAAGQSTSVRAGLAAVQKKANAAIFLLADQPFVTPALIRMLLENHRQTLAPVIGPLIDQQRGNPVLFDSATFPAFENLVGDKGARQIFSRFAVSWLPWHDSMVLQDIDTPQDYENLRGPC